jgi:hypothetical protein
MGGCATLIHPAFFLGMNFPLCEEFFLNTIELGFLCRHISKAQKDHHENQYQGFPRTAGQEGQAGKMADAG